MTGQTRKGHELELEILLLPVRPNASSQCGAIGSFATKALPSWFGADGVTSLTTRTLRMIEHGTREEMPLGSLSAPLETRAIMRPNLVVIPGGRAREKESLVPPRRREA